jgi:hypothetical protein
MQLPLTDPDTLFEELLQDLPPTTMQMARDCKAFVRAKKVKTPDQLLRLVFLYCGLDQSLREVAGTFALLYKSITDQSVAERLRACGPWVTHCAATTMLRTRAFHGACEAGVAAGEVRQPIRRKSHPGSHSSSDSIGHE